MDYNTVQGQLFLAIFGLASCVNARCSSPG